MKKILKFISVVLLLVVAFWLGTVATDKARLSDGVIRLHIVANSDSAEDQAIKLQVRDALLAEMNRMMDQCPDMETAKELLEESIPALQMIANDALKNAASNCKAVVSLAREAFPTREYDTFTLPAGVYEAVRVTIGSGEGENWWCVVFPKLCVSATDDEFPDAAVGAGFSDPLTGALSGDEEFEVRFLFWIASGGSRTCFLSRNCHNFVPIAKK